MISKLAELGYVKYDRYDIIQLTDIGQEFGSYLLRRHETVEKFLKLIGNANPLEETELIEHSLSSATVEDLNDLLEFFLTDDFIKTRFSYFKLSKRKTE